MKAIPPNSSAIEKYEKNKKIFQTIIPPPIPTWEDVFERVQETLEDHRIREVLGYDWSVGDVLPEVTDGDYTYKNVKIVSFRSHKSGEWSAAGWVTPTVKKVVIEYDSGEPTKKVLKNKEDLERWAEQLTEQQKMAILFMSFYPRPPSPSRDKYYLQRMAEERSPFGDRKIADLVAEWDAPSFAEDYHSAKEEMEDC